MEAKNPRDAEPDITETEPLYNKIVTAPNVISLVRLCLVPVYLILLLNGFDIAATIVFAVAAASDFLDGQVARRTHQVSRLGKLLDPAIDTTLMFTGVLGIFLVGRIPLWILLFVAIREAYLLIGGAVLLRHFDIRVAVIYPGKVATTLLFFGFAGMLLNLPLIPGLGITSATWLPGFNAIPVSWGIWPIYAGIILQLFVTVYYSVCAYQMLRVHLRENKSDSKANA